MNKTLRTAFISLSTSLVLGGMAGAANPKGWITGTVVNAQGQPVRGAEIQADNTLSYDSFLTTYSDAKGHYKIDVSVLPTTWHVSASMRLKYQGEVYTIALLPDNDGFVAGRVGGVRNFILKPKPLTASDPYGNLGTIRVEEEFGIDQVDESRVALTLTPVGKLADGSTGKSVTVKPIHTPDGWIVPNVMWGTYTVTAKVDGQPLELRRTAYGPDAGPWKSSFTGGFTREYYAVRPTMFLLMRPGQTVASTAAPPQRGGAGLSGTVHSAEEVRGTTVFACVRQGDGCDEQTIHFVQVEASGRTAAYRITDLDPNLQYTVFGWRDLDGDGTINAGDLLGTYGDGTPVSPPLTKVDLTITTRP